MMKFSHPNKALRVWSAMSGGDPEALVQRVEVELAVGSVGEGGEVSSRILSEYVHR